jgi:hypothetical protein
VSLGRNLLRCANFSKKRTLGNHGLPMITRICCAGSDGEATAREICNNIHDTMEGHYGSYRDFNSVLNVLLDIQPAVVLDVFFLSKKPLPNRWQFDAELGFSNPFEIMDSTVLHQWADQNPPTRYTSLGRFISMFRRKSDDEDYGISPLFLATLNRAPDKRAFLGDFLSRLRPGSWSGSLADILVRRKAQVLMFRENSHADVRQWVDELLPELDRWIEDERGLEREDEKRFE